MPANNEEKKEPESIPEDVESQLETLIAKKKEEIEKGLNDKIKLSKDEAEKKIGDIEKEFEKEKETISSYRKVMAEYESKKKSLESEIKKHLNKAIEVQKAIEKLTGATLEELKKVNELSQKLEEFHKEVEEKASLLEKDLEEKFGIVAEVLEGREHEDIIGDLEKELTKLKKIKDLLGKSNLKEADGKISPPETDERQEHYVGVREVSQEMERWISDMEKAEEEKKKPPQEEKQEKSTQESEKIFQEAIAAREKYRKLESSEDEGEISYFQKDDKIILDGENIISALNKSIEKTKKLYLQFNESDFPKDQFFVKQEIIKQQEVLRKNILKNVEMCKKDNCALPKHTLEILNIDVLKDILERASMMNWSDQGDFDSFAEYVEGLTNAYNARITSMPEYVNSIVEELGKGKNAEKVKGEN